MNPNIQNKAQAEAMIDNNVDNLSDVQQLAVIKIAKAFRFGCNWGFIEKGEELYREKILAIKEEPTTWGLTANNGCIVQAHEEWLIATVNSVIPALDFNFVIKSNERKAKERDLFEKHIKRALKAEGKGVSRDATGIKMSVGLYSTNETNLIVNNGIDYPAFKLNIEEAIYIANDVLAQNGFALAMYIKDKNKNVAPVYVRNHCLTGYQEAIKDIVRASNIFETLTGVHFEMWIIPER